MKRARDMAARLPQLYREGELVERLVEQPAQQIEIAVEDMLEVQRAHHFDAAVELEEVSRLAALLDFTPEPWQNRDLFRAWVHTQRDAVLRDGGTTLRALQGFADGYATAYQQATGVRLPSGSTEIIENPPVRRMARPPLVADDTVPLTRFSVQMNGLDEVAASFLLVGLPAAPESVPLIANLTTGEALVFRGNIEAGHRLWLKAEPNGRVTAQLERRDVTAQLVSIRGLVAGQPWTSAQVESPAKAIRLVRGQNLLWFLPVAHFDEQGLDRFLLALADLAMVQGRWDESPFDQALFYQEPAVNLRVTWVEAMPAAVEARVPAQSVRRVPVSGTAEQARDQVGTAIGTGISRLKAAGVRSVVTLSTFSEVQRSSDFLTQVLPLRVTEVGATGADRLPDKGGLFGVTEFGESTFR